MSRIEIRRADLTALAVDAIVNAANTTLLGGGGVDGAIHRAAGPALREECGRLPEIRTGVRCPVGEARITGAHRLPARVVIHTVGPIWHGGRHGEAERLASCYRSSLALAAEHDVRTIAFPAISCGAYGYPLREACDVALSATTAFLRDHRLPERVLFVGLSTDVVEGLREALRATGLAEGSAGSPRTD